MALPMWQCPDMTPRDSVAANESGINASHTGATGMSEGEITEVWQSRMREV